MSDLIFRPTEHPVLKLKEFTPPENLRHCRAFMLGSCSIFVGKEAGKWHLSIANPSRHPTWEEIKLARYCLLPDELCMAMILPPQRGYVNKHAHCFHLHEIENDGFY